MHAYSDPSRENDTYALADVEIFYVENGADVCRGEYGEAGCDGEGCKHCPEPGWYYWFCFPGCMPESDPFGPFETEAEALADAQDATS